MKDTSQIEQGVVISLNPMYEHDEPGSERYIKSEVFSGTSNGVTMTSTRNDVISGHTHPPGKLYAPSAQDLYTLVDKSQYTNGTFTTLITWGADGATYALQINDTSKLNAFLKAFPPSANLDSTSRGFLAGSVLEQDLSQASAVYTPALGMQEGYAHALASVFEKNDIGVSLQKADFNSNYKFSTVISKASVDANGKDFLIIQPVSKFSK